MYSFIAIKLTLINQPQRMLVGRFSVHVKLSQRSDNSVRVFISHAR